MPSRTRWVAPADLARLVARQGLAPVMRDLADYVLADFRRWPQFDKVARVAAHSADGVIELMPIADDRLHAFKYVNGHPGNGRFGVPTVMAYGGLADVATGFPLMISEMTIATALRTAVTSALAARWLARADARTMAVVGNGAQSEFQALAFHHLLGIDTLTVFDVDAAATDKLCRNLAGTPGLRVVRAASAADVVAGADIVSLLTADKRRATVLTDAMVEPGMHINAVGGDCPGKTEVAPEVLRRASVFVEYAPQSRVEGEIQQMPADFPVTELWSVFGGTAPGRRDAAQITLFDSVGFALEDFSMLRYLYDTCERLDIGESVRLVPALPDPRDLYGALRDSGSDAGATPPPRRDQTRSKIAAMP
ncbi:MAG: ornithine cyclodeaminase [Burkholderiaceae bacterium]